MEGQNIAIEYRYADGKVDRAPALAAELVGLKVDIIVVAGGTPWIQAAKNATKTIPIIMLGQGSDPVEAGLVESLARPGSNITGVTRIATQLGGKRLELFKEAVPKLARVAVLYVPTNAASVSEVKEVLPVAARALGLTIQPWEVRAADGFDGVFAAMGKQRSDGLYVPPGGQLMFANGNRIAAFALKSRLPSMYNSREAIDAGGLMYYGADLADSYRRVAEAQQPKKVPRIGYLSGLDPASDSTRAEAFRLALRERGYIEGQSIAISTAMQRGSAIGTLSLWLSWCVSRLISS